MGLMETDVILSKMGSKHFIFLTFYAPTNMICDYIEEEFSCIQSVFYSIHTYNTSMPNSGQYKYKNHSKHGNSVCNWKYNVGSGDSSKTLLVANKKPTLMSLITNENF